MAQNALRTTNRYKDLNINFNSHPVNGDILPIVDAEAIKRSIKNIVFTNFGERPFNPEFGCSVRSLLFEPLDAFLEDRMRDTIIQAINFYEPRARIIEVIVSGNPDNNSINVSIIFSIINNPEPVTLDVILYRVR